MACSSENQWLDTALNLAGDNRAELQKVLDRYKEEDGDKYRAACFLIENMPFHGAYEGKEMCIRDRDYFCHVFHYPGFRYFASFGKRGEAPEEMLSAENIRWHGQSLWGLDAGKSVLTKYDFTSSGCSIVPQKVINMDEMCIRDRSR